MSAFVAAIERLYQRVAMTVGRGRITTGFDSDLAQKHQVQLGADEIRDNTIRLPEYGFTSMPLPGANALVIFVGGDRSNGVIVATDDPRYRPHPLKAGEVAIYDDQGQSVYLTRTGIVINGAGLPIKVTNTPQVRMETPLLEVTGDIKDNCDTTGRTMAGDRQIYDTHTHNDPQGGVTGVPNQPE